MHIKVIINNIVRRVPDTSGLTSPKVHVWSSVQEIEDFYLWFPFKGPREQRLPPLYYFQIN